MSACGRRAHTLVQLNAPAEIRGRVIDLFNMSALGPRAFSGITVGIVGAALGVHWSLAPASACLLVLAGVVAARAPAAPTAAT